MKLVPRLVFGLTLAAGLVAARPAPAAPTVLFNDGGLGTFVGILQTYRDTYAEGGPSAELTALDKALAAFADPSTTYSEDLLDLRKAILALRPVVGSDIMDPDPNHAQLAGVLTTQAIGQTLVVEGLANRAYAAASITTRFKLHVKISKAGQTANEGKRIQKLAAIMKGIQSYARKKRISLYAQDE